MVFALVVLSVIENLLIPMMINQNINVEYGEQIPSNVGLAFVLSEEFEVPLDMQVVQSLRQEYGRSAVGLTLHGAVLSGVKLEPTTEQICITKLWVVEPLPIPEDSPGIDSDSILADFLKGAPVENTLHLEFDDFCVARGKIKIRSAKDEIKYMGVLPFATGLSPYYYPFDKRTLDLEIWVETEITYEDGTQEGQMIAPNVHAEYNLPDWQLNLYKEQVKPENRPHNITRYQLTLQRSFASRLLTTTLLSSLFIIITLLSFTHQMDAFIQASVAVLLTLLGIQDLLVPVAILQNTIVDQSILGLYILFALAVLSRLTIKPIWDRTRVPTVDETSDGDDIET